MALFTPEKILRCAQDDRVKTGWQDKNRMTRKNRMARINRMTGIKQDGRDKQDDMADGMTGAGGNRKHAGAYPRKKLVASSSYWRR